MSIIGAVTGTTNPGGAGQVSRPENTGKPDPSTPPSKGDAEPSGTAASGETTQTSTRIPPVTPSRTANAASDARPGGDGLSDAARLDAAFAPELDEARARRYAEAARQDAIQREILSQMEAPADAVPNLADSVAEVRAAEQDAPPSVVTTA